MPTRPFLTVPAPVALAATSFVAIVPMLVNGPSCGHDFDFHILSWLEAASQLAHFGFPHWAFTPAFNAGEPRFVFYPPLSWALGASLGLILPWNFVPAAFTWIALTLSGLTMYRLAQRYAAPGPALVAATLYLANPYMLFTAYERTAYGELLAAAWLPLLFGAALAERIRVLPIAVAVALLWLTNAPAGVMGCYALAFLTLVRLTLSRTSSSYSLLPAPWSVALTTSAGTALAFALDAFYILPAAYEQRFVQVNMAVIPGMRPQEHFLFHRMGTHNFDDLFHDQVVRTASYVALILLAAIAAALLAAWRKKSSLPSSLFPVPSLIQLTLLIAFLLTPPSLFLWTHLPKLAFLQFPWRLCALLAVILAVSVALALSHIKSIPYSLLPIPLSLLLVFPAYHVFKQRCFSEDTVPARVALFHSNLGTDATDEYTPVSADGSALQPGDPPYWLVPANADVNSPAPPHATPGQAPAHLTLQLATPETLILDRRQYPSWHARVNGRGVTPEHRTDGLIAIPLPAGSDTIDITPVQTPDQTLGFSLSALAILATAALSRRRSSSATLARP